MKEYEFKLTEQEINYILNVIVKQPYIEVSELIAKIHKQANEQETKQSTIETGKITTKRASQGVLTIQLEVLFYVERSKINYVNIKNKR